MNPEPEMPNGTLTFDISIGDVALNGPEGAARLAVSQHPTIQSLPLGTKLDVSIRPTKYTYEVEVKWDPITNRQAVGGDVS